MAGYTLHPILGEGDVPQPSLWYVLDRNGQAPYARVGHTTVYYRGSVFMFGGANQDGPFNDLHAYDLGLLLFN